MKYDVVIAGGGFAGAYCARALGKALGNGVASKRVALVTENNVFIFQPMLAEVAGASLSPYDVVHPLRQFCRPVDVLQGGIHKIDWAAKEIHVNGGRFTRDQVVGFKHLVLAIGSVTDLGRVPGMADYGWPMKTVADAMRLRVAVINRLEEANLVEDAETRDRLLTFVIVGGGYTGVETAGQLNDFLRQAKKYYANLQHAAIRVILVHSRAHLLEEIGDKLGDYAQRVLERRGTEVRLNSRVSEVTSGKVFLEGGAVIEAHTVVSTIGNAPNPIALDLCRQVGVEPVKGRIPVDATMRVRPDLDLWAAGDGAVVPWTDKGETKPSPPTAQFAFRQGARLGLNLAAVLRGETPKPFTYRYLGQLATIGEREAVAEVMGFRFSGFTAWWLWRTIYLAKLPGVLRRLRVMIDWTFELLFPRELAIVVPAGEEPLRSIHLEPQELLFKQGDRVRAFYLVRGGSIVVTKADGSTDVLRKGAVIDQRHAASGGVWLATAAAAERSDVMVFRGRALALLAQEVHFETGPTSFADQGVPASSGASGPRVSPSGS